MLSKRLNQRRIEKETVKIRVCETASEVRPPLCTRHVKPALCGARTLVVGRAEKVDRRGLQ